MLVCPYCSVIFMSQDTYKNHIESHHRTRPCVNKPMNFMTGNQSNDTNRVPVSTTNRIPVSTTLRLPQWVATKSHATSESSKSGPVFAGKLLHVLPKQSPTRRRSKEQQAQVHRQQEYLKIGAVSPRKVLLPKPSSLVSGVQQQTKTHTPQVLLHSNSSPSKTFGIVQQTGNNYQLVHSEQPILSNETTVASSQGVTADFHEAPSLQQSLREPQTQPANDIQLSNVNHSICNPGVSISNQVNSTINQGFQPEQSVRGISTLNNNEAVSTCTRKIVDKNNCQTDLAPTQDNNEAFVQHQADSTLQHITKRSPVVPKTRGRKRLSQSKQSKLLGDVQPTRTQVTSVRNQDQSIGEGVVPARTQAVNNNFQVVPVAAQSTGIRQSNPTQIVYGIQCASNMVATAGNPGASDRNVVVCATSQASQPDVNQVASNNIQAVGNQCIPVSNQIIPSTLHAAPITTQCVGMPSNQSQPASVVQPFPTLLINSSRTLAAVNQSGSNGNQVHTNIFQVPNGTQIITAPPPATSTVPTSVQYAANQVILTRNQSVPITNQVMSNSVNNTAQAVPLLQCIRLPQAHSTTVGVPVYVLQSSGLTSPPIILQSVEPNSSGRPAVIVNSPTTPVVISSSANQLPTNAVPLRMPNNNATEVVSTSALSEQVPVGILQSSKASPPGISDKMQMQLNGTPVVQSTSATAQPSNSRAQLSVPLTQPPSVCTNAEQIPRGPFFQSRSTSASTNVQPSSSRARSSSVPLIESTYATTNVSSSGRATGSVPLVQSTSANTTFPPSNISYSVPLLQSTCATTNVQSSTNELSKTTSSVKYIASKSNSSEIGIIQSEASVSAASEDLITVHGQIHKNSVAKETSSMVSANPKPIYMQSSASGCTVTSSSVSLRKQNRIHGIQTISGSLENDTQSVSAGNKMCVSVPSQDEKAIYSNKSIAAKMPPKQSAQSERASRRTHMTLSKESARKVLNSAGNGDAYSTTFEVCHVCGFMCSGPETFSFHLKSHHLEKSNTDTFDGNSGGIKSSSSSQVDKLSGKTFQKCHNPLSYPKIDISLPEDSKAVQQSRTLHQQPNHRRPPEQEYTFVSASAKGSSSSKATMAGSFQGDLKHSVGITSRQNQGIHRTSGNQSELQYIRTQWSGPSSVQKQDITKSQLEICPQQHQKALEQNQNKCQNIGKQRPKRHVVGCVVCNEYFEDMDSYVSHMQSKTHVQVMSKSLTGSDNLLPFSKESDEEHRKDTNGKSKHLANNSPDQSKNTNTVSTDGGFNCCKVPDQSSSSTKDLQSYDLELCDSPPDLSIVTESLPKEQNKGLLIGCSKCNVVFSNQDTYSEHMQRYHRSLSRRSSLCGQSELRKVQNTTDSVLACVPCQIIFASHASYNEHLTVHQSSRSSETYQDVNKKAQEQVGPSLNTTGYQSSSVSWREHEHHETQKPSDLVCSSCHAMFTDRALFAKHVLTDCQSRTYNVEIQGDSSNVPDKHLDKNSCKGQDVESKSASVYGCTLCNLIFASWTEYNTHCKIHTGNKSDVQEGGCSEAVSNPKDPTEVNVASASNSDILACMECSIIFAEAEAYAAHIKSHNSPDKTVGDNATDKRKMGELLKENATECLPSRNPESVEVFGCTTCKMVFTDNNLYLVHVESHNPILISDSDDDIEEIKDENVIISNSQQIQNNDTETILGCTECKMVFADEMSYTVHMQTHKSGKIGESELQIQGVRGGGNERNVSIGSQHEELCGSFKCIHCDNTFHDREVYEVHVKLHKSLNDLAGTSNHLKTQILRCAECNTIFEDGSVYRAHIRSHNIMKLSEEDSDIEEISPSEPDANCNGSNVQKSLSHLQSVFEGDTAVENNRKHIGTLVLEECQAETMEEGNIYACLECNTVYPTRTKYNKHIAAHQSSGTPTSNKAYTVKYAVTKDMQAAVFGSFKDDVEYDDKHNYSKICDIEMQQNEEYREDTLNSQPDGQCIDRGEGIQKEVFNQLKDNELKKSGGNKECQSSSFICVQKHKSTHEAAESDQNGKNNQSLGCPELQRDSFKLHQAAKSQLSSKDILEVCKYQQTNQGEGESNNRAESNEICKSDQQRETSHHYSHHKTKEKSTAYCDLYKDKSSTPKQNAQYMPSKTSHKRLVDEQEPSKNSVDNTANSGASSNHIKSKICCKIFKCRKCPEQFTSKKKLKHHIRFHPLLLRCHYCKDIFTEKHFLSKHRAKCSKRRSMASSDADKVVGLRFSRPVQVQTVVTSTNGQRYRLQHNKQTNKQKCPNRTTKKSGSRRMWPDSMKQKYFSKAKDGKSKNSKCKEGNPRRFKCPACIHLFETKGALWKHQKLWKHHTKQVMSSQMKFKKSSPNSPSTGLNSGSLDLELTLSPSSSDEDMDQNVVAQYEDRKHRERDRYGPETKAHPSNATNFNTCVQRRVTTKCTSSESVDVKYDKKSKDKLSSSDKTSIDKPLDSKRRNTSNRLVSLISSNNCGIDGLYISDDSSSQSDIDKYTVADEIMDRDSNHQLPKRLICQYCTAAFHGIKDFDMHIRAHKNQDNVTTGNQPVQDDTRSKSSGDKGNLKTKFNCMYCKDGFNNGELYMSHIQEHMTEDFRIEGIRIKKKPQEKTGGLKSSNHDVTTSDKSLIKGQCKRFDKERQVNVNCSNKEDNDCINEGIDSRKTDDVPTIRTTYVGGGDVEATSKKMPVSQSPILKKLIQEESSDDEESNDLSNMGTRSSPSIATKSTIHKQQPVIDLSDYKLQLKTDDKTELQTDAATKFSKNTCTVSNKTNLKNVDYLNNEKLDHETLDPTFDTQGMNQQGQLDCMYCQECFADVDKYLKHIDFHMCGVSIIEDAKKHATSEKPNSKRSACSSIIEDTKKHATSEKPNVKRSACSSIKETIYHCSFCEEMFLSESRYQSHVHVHKDLQRQSHEISTVTFNKPIVVTDPDEIILTDSSSSEEMQSENFKRHMYRRTTTQDEDDQVVKTSIWDDQSISKSSKTLRICEEEPQGDQVKLSSVHAEVGNEITAYQGNSGTQNEDRSHGIKEPQRNQCHTDSNGSSCNLKRTTSDLSSDTSEDVEILDVKHERTLINKSLKTRFGSITNTLHCPVLTTCKGCSKYRCMMCWNLFYAYSDFVSHMCRHNSQPVTKNKDGIVCGNRCCVYNMSPPS